MRTENPLKEGLKAYEVWIRVIHGVCRGGDMDKYLGIWNLNGVRMLTFTSKV